jgi:hypothetical protein
MSKEGVLIEHFDPKPAIKKNAEIARDWEYSDEARYLYEMAVLFRDRFLDPVLHTDRGRLPDPVISFDNLRNKKTLAAYTLHRNPQGLLDEITFNTAHYVENDNKKVWAFGRWAQLETLLHEQVHLWQQNYGENPVKPGRVSHNKEFVDKCESLGLHPMPNVGFHTDVADGVFAQLMGELGIERPDDVPGAKGEKKDWFRPEKVRGRSTLKKWECPDCGLKVRIGIKGNPDLVHNPCSEKRGEKVFLVQHDELRHTIYEGCDNEDKSEKNIPPIIESINNQLKEGLPQYIEAPTLEGIAIKFGIAKDTLYEWTRSDSEFSEALEVLQDVQTDDPFKTGTIEDKQVFEAMLALLLSETVHRYDKSNDP